MQQLHFDIVVVGASTGGVAAALRASALGANVCLLEGSTWIGGQFSSQGLTRADETEYVNHGIGCTASYQRFRTSAIEYYTKQFTLSAAGKKLTPFDPGAVDANHGTNLRVAPRVAHETMLAMLGAATPRITVVTGMQVTSAHVTGSRHHRGRRAPVQRRAGAVHRVLFPRRDRPGRPAGARERAARARRRQQSGLRRAERAARAAQGLDSADHGAARARTPAGRRRSHAARAAAGLCGDRRAARLPHGVRQERRVRNRPVGRLAVQLPAVHRRGELRGPGAAVRRHDDQRRQQRLHAALDPDRRSR